MLKVIELNNYVLKNVFLKIGEFVINNDVK